MVSLLFRDAIDCARAYPRSALHALSAQELLHESERQHVFFIAPAS